MQRDCIAVGESARVGSPFLVACALDTESMAAWQRDVVDAVRAIDGVAVQFVRTPTVSKSRRRAHVLSPSLCRSVKTPGRFVDEFGEPDVIIDFSAASVDATSRLGVWSFRLGTEYDADLPFAREFALGDVVMNAALICRRGEVTTTLRSARLPVSPSYAGTARRALGEVARWPAELIEFARDEGVLPGQCHVAAPLRAAAERPAPLPFLTARTFMRFVRNVVRDAASDFVWNVGIAPGDERSLLAEAPLAVKWLQEPADGNWIADPFPARRDDALTLFVEQYEASARKGRIVALELDDDARISKRHTIVDLPTHLSYPLAVEIDGERYLIPENAEANGVRWYRCVRFPDSWEPAGVLRDGIDAVDTTIVNVRGRWWAFFTRTSRGRDVALHAMHSDSPRGPWTDHPLNPIVIDVTCARPAGNIFEVDGQLYRPGQDCSVTYGGAIAIARIDALTTTSYRETVVKRIVPDTTAYPDGIHTVNVLDGQIIVDGKRRVFRISRLMGTVLTVIRRASRALLHRVRATGSKTEVVERA